MGPIAAWYERSLREIDDHPALRTYAVVVSGVFALVGVAWFVHYDVEWAVSADHGACWPTFPRCFEVRAWLGPGGGRTVASLYIVLSLVSAVLFRMRRVKLAFPLLAATALLGAFVVSLSYELRANETYMLSWAVLVFLFAPRKVQAQQFVIALFYFWAGTLKLNADWVSGASLYRPPFLVPAALIPASCIYVVVLELVLVWGLFARTAAVRWAVYAQLLLFHAASWNVVGFYYPLLMLGLTSIFPLVWRLEPSHALGWKSLREDPVTRSSVLAIAASFSAFQLVPLLSRGDPALTGEGRNFALHMFDARIECNGGATVQLADGSPRHVELIDPGGRERTRCDPIVLLAAAKRLCAPTARYPAPVKSVDVAIDAKHASDAKMRPLMRIDDLCNKPVEYSPWHHNEWILPADAGARD